MYFKSPSLTKYLLSFGQLDTHKLLYLNILLFSVSGQDSKHKLLLINVVPGQSLIQLKLFSSLYIYPVIESLHDSKQLCFSSSYLFNSGASTDWQEDTHNLSFVLSFASQCLLHILSSSL